MARRVKRKIKRSRSIIWAVILAIVAVLGIALLYGPNLSEGIITCKGQECLQAGHFHAEVSMMICNASYQFNPEGGLLSGQHTHKESTRIHWHSTASVDDAGQTFTLIRMISDFSISLPQQCSDKAITTIVVVNGQLRPEGLQYSWKDGDTIVITVQ